MKTLICLLLAATLAWWGYRHFFGAIEQPPGILAAADPTQEELPASASTIEVGAFHLRPLAHFALTARVLHRRNYRNDRQAALAPVDLAVGWGRMSDSAVLAQLSISQSMRFYFYEYRLPPPIPQDEIIRHSTNLHIIPADAAVGATCKSLRVGELIQLEGELVEATGPEIGTWRSSLRRDDTGNGACELVWTEHLTRVEADQARPVG